MKRKRTSLLTISFFLCSLLFSLPAVQPAAWAQEAKVAKIELDVTKTVLGNGLKVILMEDHSVPLLSYQTFFRVGSRNERPGITGISHLLEHMMFNGAKKYGPKEFDRLMESNGGHAKASTTQDMTVYYEDIASDMLELVIDLESDRMRSLAFDQKFLQSEMSVVREERLRAENSIEGLMHEELYGLAFKAHPYLWPVIGWMSDLYMITREDCIEFFRTYYAPNNAVLVVVGDFDTVEALDLIRRYYGTIPSQDRPVQVRTVEPQQFGERRVEIHRAAGLPAVFIGYCAPSIKSEDIFALDVLQKVLAGGRSSRLHRKLVRELDIASKVSIYFPWRIDPNLFVFKVKMKSGRSTVEAEEAVYAAIDSIMTEGITGRELARAKNVLEAEFVRSMQTVNGRARKIGRYEMLLGNYQEILRVQECYRAITLNDVRAVTERYFHPSKRSVVTLLPRDEEG